MGDEKKTDTTVPHSEIIDLIKNSGVISRQGELIDSPFPEREYDEEEEDDDDEGEYEGDEFRYYVVMLVWKTKEEEKGSIICHEFENDGPIESFTELADAIKESIKADRVLIVNCMQLPF